MIDTNYYYRKNLQGDVIEIYDENGSRVAAYSYDAWGNCSIIQSVNGIAELNPIRYRGYYYDSETNLYYLKSRYYDSVIGRFINADDIRYALAQSGELNGLNLFAYCLNNPINYSDPSGQSLTLILLGGLLAFFGLSAITYVETQFHPIENTFRLIGDGIDYLINDVDWQDIGASIGGFFTDIGNSIVSFWNNISFSKAGGGGRDSGFTGVPNNPIGNRELEEAMEAARKAGNFELANRILRELKNRGWRNRKKKRGGPVKGLW